MENTKRRMPPILFTEVYGLRKTGDMFVKLDKDKGEPRLRSLDFYDVELKDFRKLRCFVGEYVS